jgi:hypothetical protein
MTDVSPRERAAQQVRQLVSRLQTVPQTPVVTELAGLGVHLERAVLAFHMEAIRFRAFTMRRLVKQHAADLPEGALAQMDQIEAALEAAGFQTRSVSV